MFSEGQAYVALSRTKKLENIHILNFSCKIFGKDFEFDLKIKINNLKCDAELIFNKIENEFKEVIETNQINNYFVKNVNSNTNSIEKSFEYRKTSIKSVVSYFY